MGSKGKFDSDCFFSLFQLFFLTKRYAKGPTKAFCGSYFSLSLSFSLFLFISKNWYAVLDKGKMSPAGVQSHATGRVYLIVVFL